MGSMIMTCGEGGITSSDPLRGEPDESIAGTYGAFHFLSPPALTNKFAPRPGIKNAPTKSGPSIHLRRGRDSNPRYKFKLV